jgi:hypothetical protein
LVEAGSRWRQLFEGRRWSTPPLSTVSAALFAGFLLVVAATTVANRLGWLAINPVAASPSRIAQGKLWLMPQKQDLHFLPLLRTSQQQQQLQQATDKPIGKAKALRQQGSSTHGRTLGPTPSVLSRRQRGATTGQHAQMTPPRNRMSFWDRQDEFLGPTPPTSLPFSGGICIGTSTAQGRSL